MAVNLENNLQFLSFIFYFNINAIDFVQQQLDQIIYNLPFLTVFVDAVVVTNDSSVVSVNPVINKYIINKHIKILGEISDTMPFTTKWIPTLIPQKCSVPPLEDRLQRQFNPVISGNSLIWS